MDFQKLYSRLIENWWGSLPVYFSLLGTAYLGIWALIEPLDLEENLNIFSSSVDRVLFHVVLSILFASHVTVIIGIWGRYLRRSVNKNSGFSSHDPISVNSLTDKNEINRFWQELIANATQSVKIFAGDISWIDRDKELLKNLKDRDVSISVLCRRPKNEIVLKNMRNLIQVGASVRFYEPSKAPVVRGLVIDSEQVGNSTVFTVSKKPKSEVNRIEGVPGDQNFYAYLGRRYLSPNEIEQIGILSQLFDRTWDQSSQGFALTPLDLSDDALISILKNIQTYKNITKQTISVEKIDVSRIWSPVQIVKETKRKSSLGLLNSFKHQGISYFKSVICESDNKKSILLPPIVEKHENKFVVIDGTHRLYFLKTEFEESSAECILIDNPAPLPSEPIPFSQVRIIPRKIPREQSFIKYEPKFFRDIDRLDELLSEKYETDNLALYTNHTDS